MRLDLLVKLNYESNTILLFVGIRYSMRDLLFDPNNYSLCLTRKLAICVKTVNDVSSSSGIASPSSKL